MRASGALKLCAGHQKDKTVTHPPQKKPAQVQSELDALAPQPPAATAPAAASEGEGATAMDTDAPASAGASEPAPPPADAPGLCAALTCVECARTYDSCVSEGGIVPMRGALCVVCVCAMHCVAPWAGGVSVCVEPMCMSAHELLASSV